MKLSDEIRKWCDDAYSGRKIRTTKDLYAIADLIDREMVELPLSADGYVWTGREECFWTNAEQEGYHSFGCVALRNGKWHVEDIDGMDYEAESVWYERPDSLERIVDDIETFGNEADINDTTVEFLCKIQERIYMLAKKEGQK